MTPTEVQQALQTALEYHRADRLADAEAIYRQVLAHHPREPDALHLLGVIAHQVGQHADACTLIARAIAINPVVAEYHYNLGEARRAAGELQAAELCYRAALQRRPNYVDALHHLAMVLAARFDFDAAADALQRALDLDPDGGSWNNLGNIRKAQGKLDEAVTCFRRAIELNPSHAGMHSNLLLAMNYLPNVDAQTIFDEHLRWAQRHASPLYPAKLSHPNDRDPDRPLRIAYISPDLKQHPVGFYMEPVITSHRREHVEVFCYSDVPSPDVLSQRLERACSGWRAITGWSDERVAAAIRDDRIDILVDLAGHTANNRLLVFARKPAPVQVSYLGYVNTTGLATMDYALTDQFLDPPGAHERYRTEQFTRLPRAYVCYVPPMQCPPVGPLPAPRKGIVTFACMNNFTKVTRETMDAWARILNQMPASRLILHADRAQHLAEVHDHFVRSGVANDRVEFVGKRPLNEYYALHNEFDIALDPFPHNGGTTTCDALWMGVPLVSVAGEHAVTRAGLSLLSTVALPELAADSVERYIDLAVELASDRPRLAELRRTLRARMASSPLMDVQGFVRDLEDAYRTMWRRWCAT